MQEESTMTSGSEPTERSDALNVATPLDPTFSPEPAQKTAPGSDGLEREQISGTGLPLTISSIPDLVDIFTNPTATDSDDGGCFEPFLPHVKVPAAPQPISRREPRFARMIDDIMRNIGIPPTTPDTKSETGMPNSSVAAGSGDVEPAQAREIPGPSTSTPQPPPRVATAPDLVRWIKRCLIAQTHLPDQETELVAFWIISTWFQETMTILPCLVITGPAYRAMCVLHVLNDFCQSAVLLSGFRRSDLEALTRVGTYLISEPNLDKRTADLLSSLTDSKFYIVHGDFLGSHSASTAIWAGESPDTHAIHNSIHIHIPPANSSSAISSPWSQPIRERIPIHLKQYRDKNFSFVHQCDWSPSGFSSETAVVIKEVGRCIVGAPELRQKLMDLLKSQDQEHYSELSNSIEAVVIEATRALSREEREHAYVKEFAAEANRLLETRSETVRLNPEKVGHRLKKLGFRTRPLSQVGNGLRFDKATRAHIEQLAVMYLMEVMAD
jgi:hypothetical protein